ncbi:PEGA domain-containing protein [Candidatus Saccharibacteria bacterium]|nr:PEGA domain-containing protein [Candidatus Saccharibacteria bacterium]
MDRERKKRLQTIRLLVTETIMVVAIVVLVIVLTFVAMGYSLGKNGEVGQSGLLQVRSIPTGAIVEIDNEVLSAKTNTSKMLPAGIHKIKLSKTGYDTWEKEIVSESGWLLKLDYPRLFYNDRTPEVVREYSSDIEHFSVSPNHEFILYSLASSGDWTLLNVNNSTDITESTFGVSKLLEGRQVVNYTWNNNSDKLLVQTSHEGKTEWVVINVNDLDKSLNISQVFGMDFSMMEFASDNGESLLGLENGNIRLIMASDKTVSRVLASKVKQFSQGDRRILYLSDDNEVKLYQEGADDISLAKYAPEQKVNIAFGEYLSRKYIAIAVDTEICLYRGNLPTKDNMLSDMELALKRELAFIPESLIVHLHDQLYIAQSGNNLAVYDAEINNISEYGLENNWYYFLDDSLLATISDGRMIVRDFDGTNRRDITAATGAGFITKDSKYLIYLKSDRGNNCLMREKILE